MTLDDFVRHAHSNRYGTIVRTIASFTTFTEHWINCAECSFDLCDNLCLKGLVLLTKAKEDFEKKTINGEVSC